MAWEEILTELKMKTTTMATRPRGLPTALRPVPERVLEDFLPMPATTRLRKRRMKSPAMRAVTFGNERGCRGPMLSVRKRGKGFPGVHTSPWRFPMRR